MNDDQRPDHHIAARAQANSHRLACIVADDDLDELAAALGQGANPNATMADGNSLLECAISRGGPAAAERLAMLLAAGAALPGGEASQALLVHAILLDRLGCLEALLGAGCDPAAAGADGRTPLMAAVERSSPLCVGLLLAAGAPVDARNARKLSQTALMLAAAQRGPECLERLLEAGADDQAVDDTGRRALDYAESFCELTGLCSTAPALRSRAQARKERDALRAALDEPPDERRSSGRL